MFYTPGSAPAVKWSAIAIAGTDPFRHFTIFNDKTAASPYYMKGMSILPKTSFEMYAVDFSSWFTAPVC